MRILHFLQAVQDNRLAEILFVAAQSRIVELDQAQFGSKLPRNFQKKSAVLGRVSLYRPLENHGFRSRCPRLRAGHEPGRPAFFSRTGANAVLERRP
jgi:hypothetical protein